MNIRILLVASLVLIVFVTGGGDMPNAVQAGIIGGEPAATQIGGMAANGVQPGTSKATPPPDAEYYFDCESIESEYTANTEMPPMVISGVQFYDLGKVFSGYRRCTDVISSASVFETVYNELKASYGNPFAYQYFEKKAAGTAEWRTEDSMFSLTLKLTQRGDKMCLEMYISKWKYD